jgi:hypothetical protein
MLAFVLFEAPTENAPHRAAVDSSAFPAFFTNTAARRGLSPAGRSRLLFLIPRSGFFVALSSRGCAFASCRRFF